MLPCLLPDPDKIVFDEVTLDESNGRIGVQPWPLKQQQRAPFVHTQPFEFTVATREIWQTFPGPASQYCFGYRRDDSSARMLAASGKSSANEFRQWLRLGRGGLNG